MWILQKKADATMSNYHLPQRGGTTSISTGEWATLYVHTEDENDQIIIEPFHVYVCGPSPPGSSTSMSVQSAIPPASFSRSTDSIPTASEGPLSVVVNLLGLRPRNPAVVAVGLSSPTSQAATTSVAPTGCPGSGVLTQHKRHHLQSWLNDCRRCSASGIHRAAFLHPERELTASIVELAEGPAMQAGEDCQTVCPVTPPTTPVEPVSLAALIPSTLRSPLSSPGATDNDYTMTTIPRRPANAGPRPASSMDSMLAHHVDVGLALPYSPSYMFM